MKAAEWIDKAAEKMGGASDYALAKRMRLTRAASAVTDEAARTWTMMRASPLPKSSTLTQSR
ncbi:MAG: hypothetical protein IPO20_05955 [Gammaproteobacteria bacterium]|nr:hypothetical protein [Gammaproteobacteria bacterium]